MASLATARTRLSLAGVPKQPEGSFLSRVAPTDFAVSDTLSVSFTEATPVIETFESRSGYTQRFSQLGLNGVSRLAAGDFTKEVITLAEFNVSDTWLATLTEDPVDSNEIVGGDDWRLSITDIATLRNNIEVTDALNVSIVETIGLLQAGVLTLNVTDTWSVSFTEGTADVRVTLDVTDTLTTDLDLATPTVATPLELKIVTDDWPVTLSGEQANLQIFVGVVPLNAFDTWGVAFAEEITEAVAAEPVRYIRFTAKVPNIRFRVL